MLSPVAKELADVLSSDSDEIVGNEAVDDMDEQLVTLVPVDSMMEAFCKTKVWLHRAGNPQTSGLLFSCAD